MKAALALGTRAAEPHGGTYLQIEREDELRIARAVSDGLVEGIVRLAILTILVPFATVCFVIICWMFPGGTADPTPWILGLVATLVVPASIAKLARIMARA